jgi:dTDP-4-amino-4,6-dideoxygalactose transaminase
MVADDKQSLAIFGGEPIRTAVFPPWPDYDQEEIEAAISVLRSGKFARQSGSWVSKFEEEFAAKFGAKHAIAVSSGTAALHVALAALGIGPGDEVINTPHCFIGTATPVVHAGAVPIFADIDPHTFNIDPQTIRSKISPHTKAIIPVHLNGCPADMESIMEIAQKNQLHVIEDAAQAHGALYKGKMVGSIGEFGCFSFWEDKIITTGGEGGMVTTNDSHLAKRAKKFHHHGEDRQDGTYYQGERLYFHDSLGYNYRMTEIQGAIGTVQLKKLDQYITARRKNSHYLSQLLSDVEGIIPPYEPPEVKHVFYKYIIILDHDVLDISAEEFVKVLSAEGIPCSRRYPTPLHQQPVFVEKRGFGNTSAPFSPPWHKKDVLYGSGSPVAERLPKELVRLLMRPTFSERDIEDVARGVKKVAGAYLK